MPWPKDIHPPWDTLSDDAKKLYIRQVEVFAAYVTCNDHEIGRVIQAFEDIAAQHPDKVKEMRRMFVEEAKKYQFFPLNASMSARVVARRSSPHRGSLRAGLHTTDDRYPAGGCTVFT